MRIGYATSFATIDRHHKITTPASPQEALQALIDFVAGDSVTQIVGGLRGILLEDKSGIEHESFLPQWHGVSLVSLLQEAFGAACDVWLENDTALAGLGEATRGAGKGAELVVYHTVSTGVGGARIDHCRIDEASVGFEPGHQILDIDRTVLGPNISPTLENLVSGTAVAQRMGVPAYEIPQEDVLWDELAGYLGQGLRNSILYWSPEVIVLGGSMIIGSPCIKLEAIRKATVATLGDIVPCPFITTAQLGDNAVLYGALELASQRRS